jgi:hypothetical protein
MANSHLALLLNLQGVALKKHQQRRVLPRSKALRKLRVLERMRNLVRKVLHLGKAVSVALSVNRKRLDR